MKKKWMKMACAIMTMVVCICMSACQASETAEEDTTPVESEQSQKATEEESSLEDVTIDDDYSTSLEEGEDILVDVEEGAGLEEEEIYEEEPVEILEEEADEMPIEEEEEIPVGESEGEE